MTEIDKDILRAAGMESTAWPFEEARKIVARIEAAAEKPRAILFETGYGPSGLPHIGTFGEVARTTMVRHALSLLTDIPSRAGSCSFGMNANGLQA
jgi:lysyl-tRNA synthetase class 1